TVTNKDEIFVAGAGNDTLTGNGGMDVFNAGVGNDTIIINASNITALEQTGAGNCARVDGGGGIDTLQLEGAGLTLDLTKISDRRIQDIEVIDMTGSGDNTLKLNLDDLLDASTSTNILKVLGNSGDKVIATGFDDSTTEKTVDSVTYTVYAHSDANTSANAEIWIQKGITISDTNLPTIAITSNVSKLKAGENATITFILSEISTDFDATDIVVTGGILTDFVLKANETKIYTATFTPTLNSVTAGTISVASDKFSDAAGNINVDGADVNNSVFLMIDTKVPTIAISSDMDKLKVGESATITFTLSEVSADFDATDIVVTGGILTDFALKANETKIYTATFTPTNSATAGTISVASDKFSDAAGNTNVDGVDANNSVFLIIDTKVPNA
ncbi:hypothetical protein BSPLISOX_2323, partial [uncultured Gammaproteobacteria bacterium]